MRLTSIALAAVVLLGSAFSARAQQPHSGDAAVTYYRVRTNTPPGGECGCFGLNGGGLSASLDLGLRWAVVGEAGVEHAGNALASGKSLTLTSYLGGVRYSPLQPVLGAPHGLQPFAQVLVGGAHAGGGVAGAGDASYALAARAGGGVDLPLNQVVTVRVLQVDYFLTRFANGSNNRQNNLLFGAGLAVRWSLHR